MRHSQPLLLIPPDRQTASLTLGLYLPQGRKAVVHGDFATWNLRAENEALVAIDWEWAELDGIAGIDLCYGLLQEAVLVKKLPPREALDYVRVATGTPVCKEYLEVSGWEGAMDLLVKTAVFYRNSRKACPELVEALGSV